MSDEESKPAVPTVRPPPGDDDVYSASTVVGPMPADLLAIVSDVRAAEEERAAAGRLADKAEKPDSTAPTMVHRAVRLEDLPNGGAIPRPPPMGSLNEDVASVLASSGSSAASGAPAAAPSAMNAMKKTPLASPAPAIAAAPSGVVSGSPVAPVIGIVVVFLVAVLALAALIR